HVAPCAARLLCAPHRHGHTTLVRLRRMVLSGFVAVVGTDGSPVPQELIERLTAALAFRGPDGRATRCVGQAALGHTALSMGARSAHDCHRLSVDGTSWIVADARIDDRATLLGALPAITSPTAGTDAALGLRAFMTWDVACVDHLLGDFAFAIWDARSRRL